MTTPIINFDTTCKGNRRVQNMRACINQPKSKTTKRCAQVVCLVHFIASTRYITRKTYILNYWCILSYFWFLMSPPTLSRWNMYKNIRMVWLLAIPFQCHLIWWIFVMRLEYLQWAHGCQNNIFLFSVNHKQDKALNAISLCFFFSVLGREWGLACTWDDRRILTTKSVQRVFLGNVKKT